MLKNFSRNKIGIALFAVIILTAGTIFAFAKGGKHGHRGFGGGDFPPAFLFERVSAELGLNDEQKQQAKQILEESKGRFQPLREEMKQNREAAKNLGTDGNFDETQVNELAAKQSETMKKMFVEKEKTKAQLFAILTPEQREKAKQMQEKFGERMRGKFKRDFGKE